MRASLFLTAALGAAFLLTGCVDIDFGPSDRYQAPFQYTYELAPDGRINLDNYNGGVEISGWDQNKVEITGTRYASTEEGLKGVRIQIRNEPGSLEIRTERPSGHSGNMGARYTMQVPRGAMLDRISSSNGQIHVRDLDSGGHLKTSNGAIRAENIRGAIDAQTTNGAIELQRVAGGATMKTSNGRIRAEDIGAECMAETSNGSVDLSLQSVPKNGIRAETSNGSITVRLPSSAGARLEATTTNATISSDFQTGGEGESGSRKHLAQTLGSGGPLIELSTRNGHISVLRR